MRNRISMGFTPPPVIFSNKLIQSTVGMRQTHTRMYGGQNKVGGFTPPPDTVGGFTIPELLVVIVIVSIMAAVLLSGYPRFGEMLAIDREAQLMALAVREIEQRAVSTLENPFVAGQFKTAYGVHFSTTDNKRYWLFSDWKTQDNYFTAGEEIEIVLMERGAHIRKICKLNTTGTACNILIDNLSGLSVTYRRPSPIIEVRGVRMLSSGIEDLGPGSYMVEIESGDGSFARRIIMWTTGAVAIKKVP